jgi:hypothetical protein
MEDHPHLSGQGYDRLLPAAALGKPHRPRSQSRWFGDAGHQYLGGLKQRGAHHGVARLGYSTSPIDFARLVSFGREAEVRADSTGSIEARWHVDRNPEIHGYDSTDTGHGHQPAAYGIILDDPQQDAVQFIILAAHSVAGDEHGLDYLGHESVEGREFANSLLEGLGRDLAPSAKVLEEAPQVSLDVQELDLRTLRAWSSTLSRWLRSDLM